MIKALFPLAAFALTAPAMAQDEMVTDARADVEAEQLAWMNNQQAALHTRTMTDGWYTLEGGIKFRRISGDGTGPAPSVRDRITIHYTGSFTDGNVFDSSVERGEPATFPLSGLIRGWQVAIPYMGVGDTIEIAIPAEAAYGLAGRGPIPGGATLMFEIELLAIPSQGV